MKNSEFARWQTHSAKMRGSLRLPADSRPWTGRVAFTAGGSYLTPRQLDVLDCAWASRRTEFPNKNTKQLAQGFWANVSQAVQRRPWGDMPATLCRGTVLYSFEHDVVLTGFAHLRLLGWPVSTPSRDQFTSSEVRDMAGEGFSVPIAALILHSAFCLPGAPWW